MLLAASPDERLRRRDFADMTVFELRRLRRLMERLPDVAPMRRSRRLRAAPGTDEVYDARRTLRQAMRTQGLPLDQAFRHAQAGAAEARVPVRRVRLDGAVRPGDGDVHAGDHGAPGGRWRRSPSGRASPGSPRTCASSTQPGRSRARAA